MLEIICPSCARPLDRGPTAWVCERGHSYDVAREGYVNLLLPKQKRSASPGDRQDMLKARRAFLTAGHYSALRDAICALVAGLAPSRLVDIGCGEGYFTQALATVASTVAGIDIAKAAIRMAAKQSRNITWVVASRSKLPFADASIDVATSLFTQLHVAELQRTLRIDGTAIVVTPGTDHLLSVRRALFDTVRPHDPRRSIEGLSAAFELVHEREIRVPLLLTKESLAQLLLMTPYAWRARREKRIALEANKRFESEAVFATLSLRRER
jgi:23S rRNA (guanine745-N1)-methyltransferase